MKNDLKATTKVIQDICPDITTQEIRDCMRLGKYSEDRNRPLLVKFNRSCNVVSVLSNRHKLVKTPGVFTKPHQSPLERATESTLLHQRRILIDSGVNRKDIRIRGSNIIVKGNLYGSAQATEFKTSSVDNNVTDSNPQTGDANPTTVPINAANSELTGTKTPPEVTPSFVPNNVTPANIMQDTSSE